MSEAMSTIALGVQTKEALANLQALKAELALVKQEFATLDAATAASGANTGLLRGVSQIISEVKKLNTSFDDMTARMAKLGKSGEHAGKGIAAELKKAVDAFIETGKGAEHVIGLTNDLTGAVTRTGRAIGNMKADADAASKGLTQSLQKQVTDTELLAKAQADLTMKLRQRNAEAKAYQQSEAGQMAIRAKNLGVDQQGEELKRSIAARKIENDQIAELLRRRTDGFNLGITQMGEELRRKTEGYNLGITQMGEELKRKTQGYNMGITMLGEELKRKTEGHNLGVSMMGEELRRKIQGYNLGITMMGEELKRKTEGHNLGVTMMGEELKRKIQGYNLGVTMMGEELKRKVEGHNLGVTQMGEELKRQKQREEASRKILMADIERNEQLRIARANVDFLTASERERLRIAQKAAEYRKQEGVTPRMVEVQYGTAAASAATPSGIARLTRELEAAKGHTKGLGDGQKIWNEAMREGHSAARGLAGGFQMMWLTWGQIAPLLGGFAIASAVKGAVSAFMDLNYQMTFTKELAEGTTMTVDQMASRLEEEARGLGIGLAAAGQGLRSLAQAGLNVDQAFFALPAAFKMATVGEMEMGAAAVSLTGILNSFGKEVVEISKVSDMLTKTGSMSATSIYNLTEAMKVAAPTAHQFKVSVEETLTVLDALAKRNITGSAAGTATKNMIKEMAAPATDEARRIFKDLFNFSAYGADGGLKPLLTQIEELRTRLAMFDGESQGKLLKVLFGERGDKAFFALMAEGTDKLKQNLDQIKNSAGFTEQVFQALQLTVKGQFQLMASEIDAALGSAGQAGKAELVQIAQEIRQAFQSPELQSALTGLIQSVATLGVFAVTHGKQITAMLGAWAGYAFLGGMFTAIGAGIMSMTRAVTALTGASALMTAALGAIPWLRILGLVAGVAGAYDLLREKKKSVLDQTGTELKSIDDVIKKMDEENNRLERRNALISRGISLKSVEGRMAMIDQQDNITKIEAERHKLAAEVANLKRKEDFNPGGTQGLYAQKQAELKQADEQVKLGYDQLNQMRAQAQRRDDLMARQEALIKEQNAKDEAKRKANMPTGTMTYETPAKDAMRQLGTDADIAVAEYRNKERMAYDEYKQVSDHAKRMMTIKKQKSDEFLKLEREAFEKYKKERVSAEIELHSKLESISMEKVGNKTLAGTIVDEEKERVDRENKRTDAKSERAAKFAAAEQDARLAMSKAGSGEVDAQREAQKQAILIDYRERRDLLKISYDGELKIARQRYEKGIIDLREYLDTTKQLRADHETSQKAALDTASGELGKLKGGAKKSDVQELDNAVAQIESQQKKAQARERVNEQIRIGNDLLKAEEDLMKDARVDLPKLQRQTDKAIDHEEEARAVSLLDQAEQNLYNARQRVIDQYATNIGALEQEIMLIQSRVNLNNEEARVLAEKGDSTGADAAKKAAEQEQKVLDVRMRNLQLVKDVRNADIYKATDAARRLNDQNKWNTALEKSITLAGRMENAFGKMGRAVGGMMTSMIRGAKEQQDIEDRKNKRIKEAMENGGGVEAIEKAKAEASRESTEAQMRNYGDMLGAAKGFFSEQSKGYKALEAAQKVYYAFELASSLQSFLTKIGFMEALIGVQAATATSSIAIDSAMTDAEVINAGMRQAAEAEAAIAKTASSIPFPWNLAAAAAVAAALGVAFGGRGGGGFDVKAVQSKQSTGTVLGMEDAKSESLDKSLSRLKENSYMELTKQQEMITHLIGIKDGIHAMTKMLVTLPGVRGTAADLVDGGFGKVKSLGGLLSKNRELLDAGITQQQGQYTTVGSMRTGGYQGLMGYQLVETTKKLFGISYDRDREKNLFGLQDEFKRQVGLVISGIGDAMVQAGSQLNLDAGQLRATLDAIGISFGDLSLKGMNAEDAEKALSERISQISDLLAQDLFGGWAREYQRAGEGLAETVIRVANDVEVARYELAKFGIGMVELADVANKSGDIGSQIVKQSIIRAETRTTGYREINQPNLRAVIPITEMSGVGKMMQSLSGSATELANTYKELKYVQDLVRQTVGEYNAELFGALAIQGAGGLDELKTGLQAFKDEFFSDDQKKAMGLASLQREFNKFNLGTLPRTREEFAALVSRFDAGSSAWGKLISLADDFADVVDETKSAVTKSLDELLGEQTSYVDTLMNATKRMNDLLKSTRRLVMDITKSLGDTPNYDAEIGRQKQLMYSSNLSIEQQMEAAEELYGLIMDKYDTEISKTKELIDLGKQLSDYADGLMTGDKSPLTNSAQFQYAQTQFNDLLSRARAGDKDAANKLTSAADTYLDLARTMFASGNQYTQIFNQVYSAIQGLGISTAGGAQERLEQLQRDQKEELIALREKVREIGEKSQTAYDAHLEVLKQQLRVESDLALAAGNLYVMNDRLRDMPADMANKVAQAFGRIIGIVIPQKPVDGSHALGLDYVPFDGYIAKLHKGESVLTAGDTAGMVSELRALRERLDRLIVEQAQQTEALIKAAFASAGMSSEKVVEGTKEAVENSEWKKKAKVEVV